MNVSQTPNPFEPPIEDHLDYDADPHRPGLPWEMPGPVGRRFFQTAIGILQSPKQSFSEMHLQGRLHQARGFGVVGMTLGLAFHQFYSVAYSAVYPMLFGGSDKLSANVAGAIATAICMMLLAPIFALIALYASAGLLHFSLSAIGSARGSFETTFRVVAYSIGAASLWTIVPIIGPLLAAQGIYIQIVGIAQTHQISDDRSVASAFVFSLIVLFLIFLCVVAYLVLTHLWL